MGQGCQLASIADAPSPPEGESHHRINARLGGCVDIGHQTRHELDRRNRDLVDLPVSRFLELLCLFSSCFFRVFCYCWCYFLLLPLLFSLWFFLSLILVFVFLRFRCWWWLALFSDIPLSSFIYSIFCSFFPVLYPFFPLLIL